MSLFTTRGTPNSTNTLSSAGITTLAAVDLMISTIRYLEQSSVITRRYSLSGRTLKSTLTYVHGPSGSGDMLYGSRDCLAGIVAWHAMQLAMMSFVRLSTPENHTFSLISCLVFTKPR